MDISSSIAYDSMTMKVNQFAAEYSVGVMKAQMNFTEEIATELIDQLAQLDVGAGEAHVVDFAV